MVLYSFRMAVLVRVRFQYLIRVKRDMFEIEKTIKWSIVPQKEQWLMQVGLGAEMKVTRRANEHRCHTKNVQDVCLL